MKTATTVLVSLLMLSPGCRQPVPETESLHVPHAGPVRITGAYALYPLVSMWVREYQKIRPETSFEIHPQGSGTVWQDLLEDRIDMAMVSSDNLPVHDSLLWVIPVARLGVVVIVNASNPYIPMIRQRGLSRGELAMAFTGQSSQFWGEWGGKPGADPVHPVIRSDSAGATDQLASFLWQQHVDFTGTAVYGEDAMVECVSGDPLALGYCNFVYAVDTRSGRFREGIRIVPLNPEQKGRGIDSFYDSVPLLQRAMWSGKYPSGLIRNLYLVTKGKPTTRDMVGFLQWVLTGGQRLIAEAGYIEVPSSAFRCRLESLTRRE